jgi:DNA-binding response OmpR family regulator
MSEHAPSSGLSIADVVVLAARDLHRGSGFARTLSTIGLVTAQTSDLTAALRVGPETAIVLDCPNKPTEALGICRSLRRALHRTPILVIAPSWASETRASLLENGADCVLSEPFCPRELLALVYAHLRHRANLWSTDVPDDNEPRIEESIQLVHGATFADLADSIHLTETERRLLELVAREPRPVSTYHLMERVFSTTKPNPDSTIVRVHMSRLRKKLAHIGWTIKGLPGFGYRLARLRCAGVEQQADQQGPRRL